MTSNRKLVLILSAFLLTIVVLFIISRNMTAPRQVDRARMEQIQGAIETYVRSEGQAPETLQDLNLDAALLLDHSGHPIQYMVLGHTVHLTSFGGDQKPGGMAFKADYEHSFDITIP